MWAELSAKGVCTGLGVGGQQIRDWDQTFSESWCVMEVLRGLRYVVLPVGKLCFVLLFSAGLDASPACAAGKG